MSARTGSFHADARLSSSFSGFRGTWTEQIGEPYPLPRFRREGPDDFRVVVRAAKIHDLVVADVHSESLSGANGGAALSPAGDQVVLHGRTPMDYARSRTDA